MQIIIDSLKKGKNWISNKMIYSSIKGKTTKEKAIIAQQMYAKGESVESIAKHMGLSKSRIYEYLK
jgi:DNA invertase Pin-like site-specific DNA recombinase